MTTIAYDGKTLVADGLAVSGFGMIVGRNHQKTFPITVNVDGRMTDAVLAFAGGYEAGLLVRRYLEENYHQDFRNLQDIPEFNAEEFHGLLVLRSGEVYSLEGRLIPLPEEVPVAIGSGAPYAIAVMATGGDALAGVQAAALLDNCTGGTLRAWSVKNWQELAAGGLT